MPESEILDLAVIRTEMPATKKSLIQFIERGQTLDPDLGMIVRLRKQKSK